MRQAAGVLCGSQGDPLAAINVALSTGRTPVTNAGVLGGQCRHGPPPPMAAPGDPAALLAMLFGEIKRLQPDRPVLLMLDKAQTPSGALAPETRR